MLLESFVVLLLAVVLVVLIPLMTLKLYNSFKLCLLPIGIAFDYSLLRLFLFNISGRGICRLSQ